jgi:hypothetical protein
MINPRSEICSEIAVKYSKAGMLKHASARHAPAPASDRANSLGT